MQIYRNDTAPTNKAPEKSFTGDVTISNYFAREAPIFAARSPPKTPLGPQRAPL